jgi:hypothetical protein
MKVGRLFTEHPHSVGETYGQHLLAASSFGLRMITGGVACLMHGLLPFVFRRTGSRTIAELNEQMVLRRRGERASSDEREAQPLRS